MTAGTRSEPADWPAEVCPARQVVLNCLVRRGRADHPDAALGALIIPDAVLGALIICTLRSGKADTSRVFDQRIPLPWVCAVRGNSAPAPVPPAASRQGG